MKGDPILSRFTYHEQGRRYDATVTGGLHYLRGNRSPHFSITADVSENSREFMSGACHDLILEHRPEFADLITLHLSDIDGQPMYAQENAEYWLAGAIPWAFPNVRYHGGDSYDRAGCLAILAKHLRCDLQTADSLADQCDDANGAQPLQDYIKAQTARWKAEADICIAKHGLVVFGDPWNPSAS